MPMLVSERIKKLLEQIPRSVKRTAPKCTGEMEGQPPTKNGGSNDCRKFWMSLWPSLTGKSPEHPQSGTASDQTFFYSPEEVVNFNLHLSGDVGIIVVLEHDLLCGDLS